MRYILEELRRTAYSTVCPHGCPRHALVDERLRQAGHAVDEVRWVVNSHLHFDHAGRNAAFPAATQYVRARRAGLGPRASKKLQRACLPVTLPS